ncbi:MAG: protein DA1 [Deltaproteobacteria bacterium]|nr:protein DA1 [Deltaproteobacteria bacterium]
MKLSRKSSRLRQLKAKQKNKKVLAPCCVCQKELKGKIIGDPWENWAHEEHELTFCSCCDRIISPHSSNRGVYYKDGRVICGLCTQQAILIPLQAQESKKKVLRALEDIGFAGIPQNIEMEIGQLNSSTPEENKNYKAGETRTQVHYLNPQQVGLSHKIKVLFGVPKIEFEAILAHEFLHVWQNENKLKLAPMACEGLCELGAFLIYSQEDTAFARFKIKKMKENKDAVYGEGFRLMLAKLEHLGWEDLIDEILGLEKKLVQRVVSAAPKESLLKRVFGRLWE